MAGTTTPDNLPYPDNGDLYNPTADIQALAEATQIALDNHEIYSYRWDDSSGRTAETGMRVGDLGYQVDTDTLYRYDGASWVVYNQPKTSYSTTPSNLSVGTGGSVDSYFSVQNGWVTVEIQVLLGSSGASVGSNPTFTLPTPAYVPFATGVIASPPAIGNIWMFDSSTPANTVVGFVAIQDGGTSVVPRQTGYTSVTSTSPFTWASGDRMVLRFTYESA